MWFDFTGVDISSFDSKMIRGRKTYRIEGTYKVYFGSEDGVLRIKALINDTEVGTAEFDFNNTENGIRTTETNGSLLGRDSTSSSD
jgi:hypothetical protein